MSKKLFQSYHLGGISLQNRMVMAPMTRSRAIDNIPNELMATYYGQRAGAGLIITEGTSPSPNGIGYPRIPGIYNEEQVKGWQLVTDKVHENGGRIFLQLMHTGRVSHPLNMPPDTKVVAPSAIALDQGQMYTDQEGMQDYPAPQEMTKADIDHAIEEYVQAAMNAIKAGFDGIELHGANGYLIEQFLNTATNQRSDEYGGSAENRSRFALQVARKTVEAIGRERVGIRLSPYGVFNGIAIFDGIDQQYAYLAEELDKIGLVYIHLVDHSSMGAPEVPNNIEKTIRDKFSGTLILSGGYDHERAEHDLQRDAGDLVAFGKPFLANPDLVERYRQNAELNEPDQSTFYTPGPKGYTDYPELAAKEV